MAKHKAKHQTGSELAAKPVSGIALAASWPVYEVLLSHDWANPRSLAVLLIARQSLKSGKVAAGSFLVDLACLGVKSVQVRLHKDVAEYHNGLRAHMVGHQPMMPVGLNLAAKIILVGLEYATQLGFKPDAVFAQALPLLEGADPTAEPTPVHTGGPDGKPLFINGPYDHVDRVIAQLTRAVGEGNFHVVLGSNGVLDNEWDA